MFFCSSKLDFLFIVDIIFDYISKVGQQSCIVTEEETKVLWCRFEICLSIIIKEKSI